jgi:hybrid cluster-associated redox disulfide protein
MKTSEMLDKYPAAMEIFTEYGMLCMDCVCSEEETVEESCRVHLMDVDSVIDTINEKIAEEKSR